MSSLNDSWRINSIITFGFTYQYITHNSNHLCHYRYVHNDWYLVKYRNFWWMSNFLLHTHNCSTEYFYFYTQSTDSTPHWPVYKRQMLSWFITWKHHCLILTHKVKHVLYNIFLNCETRSHYIWVNMSMLQKITYIYPSNIYIYIKEKFVFLIKSWRPWIIWDGEFKK
jgi:hypothetical protein